MLSPRGCPECCRLHSQVAGFINFVKQDNMFYPACTLQRNGRTCNKKAMEQSPGSGTWCALLMLAAVCQATAYAVMVR